MTVKLLETGYWHVRFSLNKFFQWPTGRLATLSDGFPVGWCSSNDVERINRAVDERLKEGK